MVSEKIDIAPRPGTPTLAAISEYVNQHHALTLIRHLNPLVIAMQQHRGASLALLEGDESFEIQVNTLRQDISRRVGTIRQLNMLYQHVIPEDEWNELQQQWEDFISRWREDGILSNFEFHNLLVDRLIQLIWQMVQDANHLYPSRLSTETGDTVSAAEDAGSSHRNHHLIVQLVCKDVLQLIENIAMARGLSVHTAVIGNCDLDHQAKLNHLLQTIGYKKEKIRTIHRSLHRDTLKKLPTLVATLLHEHKLAQLLQMIKNDVILPDEITIDSHLIFQVATEIIDIYSEVIGQGLDMVQQNLDATLIG